MSDTRSEDTTGAEVTAGEVSSGKQPFSLGEFERLWPTNPIERVLGTAKAADAQHRAQYWQDLYDHQFRRLDTVPAFVEELKRLLHHGFFD